jgi:hypothetical protein
MLLQALRHIAPPENAASLFGKLSLNAPLPQSASRNKGIDADCRKIALL